MTDAEWEDFIHSEAALGAVVRIEIPAAEQFTWPMATAIEKELQRIATGSHVVQFDPQIDWPTGVVVGTSYCGWLKVEIADHGVIDVPGRYLKRVE